ncbi:MAG: CCA tRNA nucleotidyltransferase [Oscillospiraceae bacterium]
MNIIIPHYTRIAMEILNKNGFRAYAVGGCIRDSLLGKAPHDWDICTDCLPEKMKEIFSGFRTIDTGIRHGTVTVMIENELVEITTFRSDGEYENHRKPAQVEFVGNLEQDLMRRDFTVNAMCCDIDGKIYDYYGGREDLKNHMIRCVGETEERFEEDALRILRGLRFASVLGFQIEADTRKAIYEKKRLLKHISAERIRDELTKLICGKSAERILNEYRDIIGVIIPEIIPCFDFEQNNPHHCYTVWEHIAKSVSYVRPGVIIRTAMLLHDIGKPQAATRDENGISHFKKHQYISAEMARDILKRLKFDNRSIDYIHDLIWEHDNRIPPQVSSVKRFVSKYGFQFVFDYLELRRGDTYAQSEYKRKEKLRELDEIASIAIELMEQDACLKISDLAVDGNDLIKLGLEGKVIGEWLQRLLELVIDDKLCNVKQNLLDYIKEHN